MTELDDALERLGLYNGGTYSAGGTPQQLYAFGGVGGMDRNWVRCLRDVATVGGAARTGAASAGLARDAAVAAALAQAADNDLTIGTVTGLKEDAEAARDAAQEARDLAEQYRDEAQGAVGGVRVSGGDTTPAPLGTKLTVSPGLTKSTTSPGGNEALNLAVDFASDAEAATGAATAKAVTPAALKGWVPALTEITGGNVDPAADFIPIYDASGAVVRKVKPNNLGITSGMTNPMTTAGDLIYGGVDGAPMRLPKGPNGAQLTMQNGVPRWTGTTYGYVAGGDLQSGTLYNVIDRFAFSASSNAADVGDLTVARRSLAGASDTVGHLEKPWSFRRSHDSLGLKADGDVAWAGNRGCSIFRTVTPN